MSLIKVCARSSFLYYQYLTAASELKKKKKKNGEGHNCKKRKEQIFKIMSERHAVSGDDPHVKEN